MLGNSCVVEQLAASQEGLGSTELVPKRESRKFIKCDATSREPQSTGEERVREEEVGEE
jgi:hypothetical protein